MPLHALSDQTYNVRARRRNVLSVSALANSSWHRQMWSSFLLQNFWNIVVPERCCLQPVLWSSKQIFHFITCKWAMHSCHYVICVHTCMHCGLMCGIWDWQSTIVKDLNDSQDPKHTLFCRENTFDTYLIFVTNATNGVGVLFSSRCTFFHRERERDCFEQSLFI